ncbi:MAG: recombinase family protein [Fimbriimonadaceae bacterium]|nr:recombinase family protein [Fimbriimonadaceae bacterium]
MSYGRRSARKAVKVQEVQSAVLYARVSTKEQEQEGYSLDAQLGLLRRYAQDRGLQVIAEFVEAETAKEAGRSEFQQMLSLVRSKRVSAILCEKIDRLYRNLSDRVKVGELAVALHFVKEGTILTPSSKSHEKFIHDIKLVVAKNYIDNLSEETRKGMEEKARQGIWPSYAPYGYINVVSGAKRTIRLDKSLAPKIKRLFVAYADEGLSLDSVRRLAIEIGLRSRNGNRIHKSGIAQILSNPIYCGLIQWNRHVYVGSHEPVVSKELFEKVQDVMHGRNRNKTGFGVLEFTYKGMLTCAHCGCAITAEMKKGKYVYYHCTGRKGRCPGQKCIEEEQVTTQISNKLRGLRIDPEILEMLRRALLESLTEERAFHVDQRESLEAECKSLEAKLEALYIDKLNGQVPLSAYDKLKAKWELELDQGQLLLSNLGKAQSSYFELGVSLLELGSNCHSRFEKANSKEKRELLKVLCSNSLYDGRYVQLSLQEPFKSMLETCEKNGENREIENWLPAKDSNLD